ncbi:MAG: hypothetical protein IJU96_02030 [Clostridia bacterium]|nr:hypothetical protein [Clostridia bacterium]
MSEFWATLKDGLSHLFDPVALNNFLSYVLNILNEAGVYVQKFYDMLP